MTAVDYDQIHADAIAESCNVPVDVAATAVDRYSRGDLARWVGLMYGTRGGKDLAVRLSEVAHVMGVTA